MSYIQLVTYRCTDAPFTGVLKNFRTIVKKFRTWSKFQDISGQLLKFQEYQDNAQAGLCTITVALDAELRRKSDTK